jgi:hypothetical protein
MRIPLACMRGHRGGKGCMCWRFTPRVLMLVRDLSKGWKSAECWCDLTNGGVDIGKNHVWEESRFLTRIMSMFDLGRNYHKEKSTMRRVVHLLQP